MKPANDTPFKTPMPESRPPLTWTRLSARNAFHVLLAASGWVLFLLWWAEVLETIRFRNIATALALIGLTVAVTAALTLLWVRHNIGIYRRKGPRRRLLTVEERCDADALGRRIVHPGTDALRQAQQVIVSVDGDTKRITPSAREGPRAPVPAIAAGQTVPPGEN